MSSTSAQGLTALSSTLLGLCTIAITLRFYARHTQKAALKSDDLIMIPCLLLFIGTTGCTFVGVRKKVLGYPTPKDPEEVADTAEMTSKLYFVFDLFSTTTLGCTKIGALLFFRRIFCIPSHRTFFAHLTLITIIIVALWTVCYDILTGLTCGSHFSALWTGPQDYAHYCRQTAWRFLLSLSISDFLLDIWILSLPLPQIWAIQASLKRRFGVMGVFLLALVGLAACIARLASSIEIFFAGPNAIIDPRLVNTKQLYLSVLENGLSLIAVNLPSLWCLFTRYQLESVLRSVRSILSLRSNVSATSMGKPRSHSRLPSLDKNLSASNSSQSHLAHPQTQSIETYAMRDIEEGDFEVQLPQGGIQITDRITQSAVHV